MGKNSRTLLLGWSRRSVPKIKALIDRSLDAASVVYLQDHAIVAT